MQNHVNADLVFPRKSRNPEPDEIQPVNESEQVTQFELANYNILYPLPYEQMDQRERSVFKTIYTQNIRERENPNREDVSNCFANSTCLALTCCSTQGFFFAVSEIAKIPVCLEFTVPLTIVVGCFVYGGVSKCPEAVIKFPARSLSSVVYVVKDFCTELRDRSTNEDLIYTDSEDNKKLREEFENIKTTKILYSPEENKYYIAKPTTLLGGKVIETSGSQPSQDTEIRSTGSAQNIPSQLLM